jgi:cytosine/adenosine deaminase-related metal-dependent hydrolase
VYFASWPFSLRSLLSAINKGWYDMPTQPIVSLTEPKYGLEGRIVTMNNQRDILDKGVLYIDKGVIQAVLPEASSAPADFAEAPIIRTGDTIYPGLIELHNHLSYNILPMWLLPRLFSNRGQWGGHEEYKKFVSGPMKVLGETPGYAPAIVRYTEVKCLLSGVTTSQGFRLYSNSGIQTFYRGIVRNVEKTDDAALPDSGGRIADVHADEAGKFLSTLEDLNNQSSYLLHLAEGVDDTARKRFTDLQLPDGRWAITPSLVGIHASSLNRSDFDVMHDHGGSVVWSPFSNLLLYGDTMDIQAAKESQILMGLGSDWSPSGSKNLLGELKTARIISEARGNIFSDEELVAMATINAARMLKWDQALGSLEAGKRADLLVVNGRQGDPYAHLIEARETTVTLVVINGDFRYGQPRLMDLFSDETEDIKVGSSNRKLNLLEEGADPIVGALTLAAAEAILRDGLLRIKELAHLLDTNQANNIASALVDAGVPTHADPWFLDLNHDDPSGFTDDEHVEAGAMTELFSAAEPLATIVEPILLDPLTVADDDLFFHRLANQPNLPATIKGNLPSMYGREPVLPEGAEFVRRLHPVLQPQFASTAKLATFRERADTLTRDERLLLVEQAQLFLEQLYVHLPQKQAMHANNPVQALRLLHYRISQMPEDDLPSEIEFHQEITRIFTSNRDLHTNYLLPFPFRQHTAFLPFVIEQFFDEQEKPRYIVSKVLDKPGDTPDDNEDLGEVLFEEGVEVLYWNGVPTHRAVLQNADRQAGGNSAARHARGLDTLTIRPLVRISLPDEEWVTLRYLALDDREMEVTFPWFVFTPDVGADSGSNPDGGSVNATSLGYDLQTDAIHQVKKLWFAPDKVAEAQNIQLADDEMADVLGLDSFLPTIFRAERKETPHGEFGYIRIFSFNVNSAAVFVNEFVRLVKQLPEEGLIIDVRGNGGGLIYAAEQLLQVLTPNKIEPQRAQFINSSLTLAICRQHAPSTLYSDLDLTSWRDSISQSVETGSIYSRAFHITPPELCNNLGQQYFGPVVLITDALCYSATDIFAAGFQDHGIGKIIGTSENTGAGGANVWTHNLLGNLMAEVDSPIKPLPFGAGLRVAIRRTLRVNELSGMPLEDFGVKPDYNYKMTKKDLLHGNADLITFAGSVLFELHM